MPSEDSCCSCPCPCGPRALEAGLAARLPADSSPECQPHGGSPPAAAPAPGSAPSSAQAQGRLEMTTEQRAASCGLGMVEAGTGGVNCRGVGAGRAEAFARSLHNKLRSLGGVTAAAASSPSAAPSANGGNRPDSPEDMDDSWSSAPSGPSSLAARRTLSSSSVDSNSDLFYDLDLVPQSPEEEVTSLELAGMMAGSANRDDLYSNGLGHVPAGGVGPQSPQSDCSSDYFDTDCLDEDRGPPLPPLPPPPADANGIADAASPLTNGASSNGGPAPHLNGHGPAKAKRPWNRVPHRFKAGTPEAMSEVCSKLDLDDPDDDDEDARPRRAAPASAKPGLAKLSFPKSSQTLLQEGLIEQLRQGRDIPPELKNGLCPCEAAAAADAAPAAVAGRGLAAMKEKARTLDALATPVTPEDVADGVAADVAALRLDGGEAAAEAVPPCGSCGRACDGRCSQCAADARDSDACADGQAEAECEAEAAAGHNGHHTDGEDDEEDKRPRIRRCSSLKTGKTPPGTPGRKKIVRFADVLGLDLADVRTFLDEIPKVPTSAYSDLTDVDPLEAQLAGDGCLPSGQLSLAFNAAPRIDLAAFGVRPVTRVLVPLFQQPGGMADFLDRVRDRRVCLENAVVADAALLSIAGQVRVRNLDFHKTVHLRYTTDGWRSFADLQATYVVNSCDGFSDKFTFTLFAGHTMAVGQRLEMAVRFQCKGQQYWDNNAGANYCFQCLPPSGAAAPAAPTMLSLHGLNSPSDDGWKYLF